jgi:hypothetical protein
MLLSRLSNCAPRHQHRPSTYGPQDYTNEFGEWKDAFENDANVPSKNTMIGPSLALANWDLEQVWDTGFLTDYQEQLYALSVERLVCTHPLQSNRC